MGDLDTRETMVQEPRIISLVEAAKIIGTSYTTAVRLAKSGELQGVGEEAFVAEQRCLR